MLLPIAFVVGIRAVVTPSVPEGIWWIRDWGFDRAAVTAGTYISMCLPERSVQIARERAYIPAGWCPGHIAPIVKRVAAVPGDIVRISNAGMFVNGRPVKNTRRFAFDERGRPIPAIRPGTYKVRADQYWLVGDALHSWDSRYWGPVRMTPGIGIASPLFLIDW